jgi:hypothetical protein
MFLGHNSGSLFNSLWSSEKVYETEYEKKKLVMKLKAICH